MKPEIESTKLFKSFISAKAYKKGFIRKIEVGEIGLAQSCDYFLIRYFHVKEKYRNKGVGKELLNTIIEELQTENYSYIEVVPNSDPYEGESYIDNEKLYSIYQHLGFEFVDENADPKAYNNKMRLKRKQ
jgi:GNAT superfamily N-acetyltransferase